MELINNERYRGLLHDFILGFDGWDRLSGKSFLISGATGMLGSFLIDAVMLRNSRVPSDKRCRILATSRNQETAEHRFASWLQSEDFFYFPHDIAEQVSVSALPELPDYVIHAASTTHPVQYASEPVNTIFSNVLGTKNLLELTAQKEGCRFLLLSSVEIYGENRGDVEYFGEDYCGYLDCNTLRAGYPEAKRVSETLCQAYIREKGVDAVILRLPRCYGPTMRMSDTKALSQFIKKGLAREDIVLKSEGNQFFSYAFVADAALGMLCALTKGARGEAYNLADSGSDITLKELAALVAETAGRKVVFELPGETERVGYSTATRAVMRGDKLKAMGWRPQYDIKAGIELTMGVLRNGI